MPTPRAPRMSAPRLSPTMATRLGGNPQLLEVDEGVAGTGDRILHLAGTHDEHARATPARRDDLTDDLERAEGVLGHGDAKGVQSLTEVGAGRPRVVGDERESAAGPVEGGQRLAGPGIQDVAVPDTPVEIEHEPGERPELHGGHAAAQSRSVRRNSAIASAYTASVRSATLAHANFSSTRRRPAWPIARASAGSSSRRRMAAASSSGRDGGSRMPVLPSSTTSTMPPTAEATTAVPHAIAPRVMRPDRPETHRQTKTGGRI